MECVCEVYLGMWRVGGECRKNTALSNELDKLGFRNLNSTITAEDCGGGSCNIHNVCFNVRWLVLFIS